MVSRAQPRKRLSDTQSSRILWLSDWLGKNDRRKKCERVITPTFFFLLHNTSVIHYFQSQDKISFLSQRRAHISCVSVSCYCPWEILHFPFPYSIPFHKNFKSALLHKVWTSRDFILNTQRTPGVLEGSRAQETPTPQLAQADRLHFPLPQPLAPAFCHFVPTHGLPTDFQKPASCPPLPLQHCSLFRVTPPCLPLPPLLSDTNSETCVWGWNFVVAMEVETSSAFQTHRVSKNIHGISRWHTTDNLWWRRCTFECHLDKEQEPLSAGPSAWPSVSQDCLHTTGSDPEPPLLGAHPCVAWLLAGG